MFTENWIHFLCRYCLWILGNAATLINSDSVWRNVVLDAKRRDCFHNAVENKNLAQAINDVLFEIKLLEGSESPFKKLSLSGKSEKTTTSSSSRWVEIIYSLIYLLWFWIICSCCDHICCLSLSFFTSKIY